MQGNTPTGAPTRLGGGETDSSKEDSSRTRKNKFENI